MRLGSGGGSISRRIASNTTRNWESYFRSSSASLWGQVGVGRQHAPELDERSDDLDAGLHGDWTVEDAGEHHGAVFGERHWRVPAATPHGT